MTKEKLMDIAKSTANELRKTKVASRDKAGTYGSNLKVEPFHQTSFLRGVEFAYNQMTKVKP